MDDLRWVLLLVGAVVVAAIYLSGRFESEDWTRERKQFAKDKPKRSTKKAHRENTRSKPSPAVAREVVKKEPRMDAFAPIAAGPVAEEPAVSEPVIETPTQQEAEPEVAEVNALAAEDSVPSKQAAPRIDETNNIESAAVSIEEQAELIEEQADEESTDDEQPVEKPIAADIEDEITDIEIPVDLAVAEAELQIADIADAEQPAQTEVSLDIEPLVLSVIVHAHEDEVFSGPEIREALEAEGLSHGAMSIFHFYDPDKEEVKENDDAVFSVANVLEPGFFDLKKLDETETPGLMLFCQLPGPLSGEAALELMLDKGRGLAVRLNGQMCDDKRNPFTTQAKTYYQDKIATFKRELELAKKKADA